MPGRYAQAYLKAYKAAQKVDDRMQSALVGKYGGKAGDARYRYDAYDTSTLKRLRSAKRKADERMHSALAAMRDHGESVHGTNPAIPRNKWITGKVMITKSGTVKFRKGR